MRKPLGRFGEEMRKLRKKHSIRLLDVASKMNVSVSFLSAVEIGVKRVSDRYIESIATAMNLDDEERRVLVTSASYDRPKVEVNHLSDKRRALVDSFAKKVNRLNDAELKKIREMLDLYILPRANFSERRLEVNEAYKWEHKRHPGFVVQPRDKVWIHNIAENVRRKFCPDQITYFPIEHVVEFELDRVAEGFSLFIVPHIVLPEYEAAVHVRRKLFCISELTYRKVIERDPRARFTMAHELGHLVMHRNEGKKVALVTNSSGEMYRDSEWQADVFAQALLISRENIRRLKSTEEAVSACRVSHRAAEMAFRYYSYLL